MNMGLIRESSKIDRHTRNLFSDGDLMRRVVVFLTAVLFGPPVALHAQTPFETLQRFRSEYPTPMAPAQIGELLNRVAWTHRAEGYGLLRKDGGARCPHPGGTFVSCDILISTATGHHYDVLVAQEAEARPVWRDVGPCVLGPSSGCEMSRFLAPTQPGGSTTGPDLGPTPDRSLHEAITALTAQVRQLHEHLAGVQQGVTEINRQLTTLSAKPHTALRGSLLGLPIVLRPQE
jgi:hypothetical protein